MSGIALGADIKIFVKEDNMKHEDLVRTILSITSFLIIFLGVYHLINFLSPPIFCLLLIIMGIILYIGGDV
jgi:hypothetical protein